MIKQDIMDEVEMETVTSRLVEWKDELEKYKMDVDLKRRNLLFNATVGGDLTESNELTQQAYLLKMNINRINYILGADND